MHGLETIDVAFASHQPIDPSSSVYSSQPKFLTKAQRAAIALEKRQQEINGQKETTERARKERMELEDKAAEERRRAVGSDRDSYGNGFGNGGRYGNGGGANLRGGYGGGRGGYDRGESLPTSVLHSRRIPAPASHDWLSGSAPESQDLVLIRVLCRSPSGGSRGGYQGGSHNDRDRDRPPPPGSMPPPRGGPSGGSRDGYYDRDSSSGSRQPLASPSSSAPEPSASGSTDSEIDLASIKARYLGLSNEHDKKRKARKISDKKFIFDWEADEDTGAGAGNITGGVMLGGNIGGMADPYGGRGRIGVPPPPISESGAQGAPAPQQCVFC